MDTLPKPSNILTGYKYLVLFSMLYMSIMICNVILTNRYVSLTQDIFVLGGTLTSPFVFILGDVVAEIFGYRVAKQMLWSGFACQMIFAMICGAIASAPYPAFFKEYQVYFAIFNPLLYLVLSSFVAFIISGLINIYIITKWKVLLQGRYFWLRSLGSSTIAEALYSAIAILMMEINAIPLSQIWHVILISYGIKVTYSIIFAWPGTILVNYIKATANIDIYDSLDDFNPFKHEVKENTSGLLSATSSRGLSAGSRE